MRIAIKEASRGIGLTAPNPAVGAVLVKNGRILAKGHHHAAGLPHAEIKAISKALRTSKSSPDLQPSALSCVTLYVTLEPCSSYGATDPDSRHRGSAEKIFTKAKIEVRSGILAEECASLNAHWNHRILTGLPWVIAKAGMSLDGRLDSPPHRRWITSAASRKEAMHLRASVEAILVGGGTVRADDPALTIRGIKIPKGHPQPWRIVWVRSGKIPSTSNLLTDVHRDRTLVFTGMTLRAVLKKLGKRGISSVLIEGGGQTLGEAFKRKLVDEVRFFIAPVIQGGNVPAVSGTTSPVPLENVSYKKIGWDVMISARVKKD